MNLARRSIRRLGVVVVLLAALTDGGLAHAFVSGGRCTQPQPIIGFGSQAQFPIQYGVFIPAYEASCSKAAGFVSYYSGDDATTYGRALNRGPDFDHDDLFWALDRPLTTVEKNLIEQDTGRFRGSYSLLGQFPLYERGIGVAYNLTCQATPIKFSGTNLSLIYLGVITSWNDPRLVEDNPGLASCARTIKLTGRADVNGETTTFKTYLSKWSPVWTPYAQPNLNTQWPAPLVCRGGNDAGELGCVASQPGSIGYVDIVLAQQKNVPLGSIQRPHIVTSNPTSSKLDFASPSMAGCTAAAASIALPPTFDVYSDWNNVSLVNATDGYPMCYFSFMLAFQKPVPAYSQTVSIGQAQTLRDYLNVIFSSSVQQELTGRGVALLPQSLLSLALRGVRQIEYPTCPLPAQPPAPVFTEEGCYTVTHQ